MLSTIKANIPKIKEVSLSKRIYSVDTIALCERQYLINFPPGRLQTQSRIPITGTLSTSLLPMRDYCTNRDEILHIHKQTRAEIVCSQP